MPMDKRTGVISSKYPEIEIPDEFVHDFILRQVLTDFDPHRPFETESATGVASTYGWFMDTQRKVASWLRKKGIQQGDRVAFYSTNCVEYTPCVLATWRVGGVCTFIRPEMIADKKYQEAVGIPKLVFAAKDKVQQLLGAGYESIVVYRCYPGEVPQSCYLFDEILDAKIEELGDVKLDGDPSETFAIITFSGGITGNPKPIQLSHRNVISSFAFQANGVPLWIGPNEGNDVQLFHFPALHVTGITFRFAQLLRKGQTILMDPPVLPRKLCEAVEKYRVNFVTTIPVVLLSLMRFAGLGEYDLTSWKTLILMGGPFRENMQKDACEKLGIKHFYQCLGMSECCGTITCATLVPESVGDICANTQAKVVSFNGSSLVTEPGVVGELCVRGPQVMLGYYNLTEMNKSTFDGDGFLHTGDLVSFDDDFNFYFFDRAREFIRHQSGRMISATRLELTIAHENPEVSEVSVIQSTDGPRAIVVPVAWPENEEAFKRDIIARTNAAVEESWSYLSGGVALLRAEDVPRTVFGKHLKRFMKNL